MRKFIRKITKASTHSYTITIPKELIKKFGWRERQKVEIIFGGKKHEFKVRDWLSRKQKRSEAKKLKS